MGNFEKALEMYESLYEKESDPSYHLAMAVCYFHMKEIDKCVEACEKGPSTSLKKRILANCGKLKDVEDNTIENYLCKASLHFGNGHFQDAFEI